MTKHLVFLVLVLLVFSTEAFIQIPLGYLLGGGLTILGGGALLGNRNYGNWGQTNWGWHPREITIHEPARPPPPSPVGKQFAECLLKCARDNGLDILLNVHNRQVDQSSKAGQDAARCAGSCAVQEVDRANPAAGLRSKMEQCLRDCGIDMIFKGATLDSATCVAKCAVGNRKRRHAMPEMLEALVPRAELVPRARLVPRAVPRAELVPRSRLVPRAVPRADLVPRAELVPRSRMVPRAVPRADLVPRAELVPRSRLVPRAVPREKLVPRAELVPRAD